jgi:Ran GTPase-activating protein (RanGAP) involved in mRNA processing and transport
MLARLTLATALALAGAAHATPADRARVSHDVPTALGPAAGVSKPLRTTTHTVDGAVGDRRDPAWQRFAAALPGLTQGSWDEATRVPSRLWGRGLDVPGASADPAIAAAAARAVLAAHVAVLAPGSRPEDFVLVANHVDAATGQRSIGFAQHHGGLPVVGGQVSFRFKRDRLFVLALDDDGLDDDAVAALAPAAAVERLALAGNAVTAVGVRALAATPRPALRALDLGGNPLGAEGARAVAAAPWAGALVELAMRAAGLDDAALAAVVAGAPRLVALDVADNPISDLRPLDALAALARLDVSDTRVDGPGLAALVTARAESLIELRAAGLGAGPAGATALAAVALPRLTHLDLGGWGLGDDGARAVAAASRWPAVTSLALGHNQIGDAGARALAAARGLGALRELTLTGNQLGADGARALADASSLNALVHLELLHNPIPVGAVAAPPWPRVVVLSTGTPAPPTAPTPDAGVAPPPGPAKVELFDTARRPIDAALLAELDAALAAGTTRGLRMMGPTIDLAAVQAVLALPHAHVLEVLDLSVAPLGEAGAKVLAAAAPTGLRELRVATSKLGDAGVAILAASPRLAGLRTLDLSDVGLTAVGMRALAAATFRDNLERLDVSGNRLGEAGLRLLARAGLRPRELFLVDVDLTERSLSELLAGPASLRLEHLELRDNDLGPDVGKALTRWPGATSLRWLGLARTNLGDRGARALAAGGWDHLEALDLTEAGLGPVGAAAIAAGRFPALRYLDLRDNDLSPDVEEALATRWAERVKL